MGVGGGGSNAVNRMLANQLTGVEMYVMNTDAQVSAGQSLHAGAVLFCRLLQAIVATHIAGRHMLPRAQLGIGSAAHMLCLRSSRACCVKTCRSATGCIHALQALAASPLPTSRRVQIGSKLTRGLGAGGNPGVGLVSNLAVCMTPNKP